LLGGKAAEGLLGVQLEEAAQVVADGEGVDVCKVLGEEGAEGAFAGSGSADHVDEGWFGRALVGRGLACLG
jgi:hypothetical protein